MPYTNTKTTMIKQIRIDRGYTSIAAFAQDIGISQSRYYSIERLLIKATPDEFKLIGGVNYDDYSIEYEAKKTLMFTSRMIDFASYCGSPDPSETVQRYFANR